MVDFVFGFAAALILCILFQVGYWYWEKLFPEMMQCRVEAGMPKLRRDLDQFTADLREFLSKKPDYHERWKVINYLVFARGFLGRAEASVSAGRWQEADQQFSESQKHLNTAKDSLRFAIAVGTVTQELGVQLPDCQGGTGSYLGAL